MDYLFPNLEKYGNHPFLVPRKIHCKNAIVFWASFHSIEIDCLGERFCKIIQSMYTYSVLKLFIDHSPISPLWVKWTNMNIRILNWWKDRPFSYLHHSLGIEPAVTDNNIIVESLDSESCQYFLHPQYEFSACFYIQYPEIHAIWCMLLFNKLHQVSHRTLISDIICWQEVPFRVTVPSSTMLFE